MRKYIALVLVLVCVLGLVGCNIGNDSETPSTEVLFDAPENESQSNRNSMDNDAVEVPTGDTVTDVAEPNLNMLTLKDLVERDGESLTWTDFISYYSEEVASDLYTLRYPIDPNYYLQITGNPEEAPVCIWLVSAYDSSKYIEVRTDSIDDFIDSPGESADTNVELMVDPVAPVTIQNNFTGEKVSITSNEDIRIISNLLFSDLWNTEGTADCANNIGIIINGAIFQYHSDCGTFNDSIDQRSLSLNDATKEELNAMLAKYISLTSEVIGK